MTSTHGVRICPLATAKMQRKLPRGFATIAVFGVIILASVMITMVQTSALSQAAAGREAVARVRAYWAARAGVEAMIARVEFETENPTESDAFALLDDMAEVASGEFVGASYRVATWDGKSDVLGPTDLHSKININRMSAQQLLTLEPYMTEDVADAILDWIDADDDLSPLGAELGYYQSMPYPYEPRNGPFRSIAELELVAGVDARDVRGEDWNLNGLLDPNEDDGDASWPPDNADGQLDRGWSGVLTALSVDGTMTPRGAERLDLTTAKEGDLVDRARVNQDQAKAIIDYVAASPNATMQDFILRDINQLAQQASGGGGGRTRIERLTNAQLGYLLDEAGIGSASQGAYLPGKLNINTCSEKTLEYLPEISSEIADAIIGERSGKPQGFTSVGQLLDVPGMTRRQFAAIYELVTTRSNVYLVTSKGRDERTGIDVEIQATIDRSTLPVVIQEVQVR